MLQKEPIIIFRDEELEPWIFVHVDDVVQAYIRAAETEGVSACLYYRKWKSDFDK